MPIKYPSWFTKSHVFINVRAFPSRAFCSSTLCPRAATTSAVEHSTRTSKSAVNSSIALRDAFLALIEQGSGPEDSQSHGDGVTADSYRQHPPHIALTGTTYSPYQSESQVEIGEVDEYTPVQDREVYMVKEQDLHNLVQSYGSTSSTDARNDSNSQSRARPQKPEKATTGAIQTQSNPLRIFKRLMDDKDVSHTLLMEAYEGLDPPKVGLLSKYDLRRFVSILCRLPNKDEPSKMRFFRVMSDMRAANMPIPIDVWTSAMHFAGRWVKRLGNEEVQASLAIWKEMEAEAGIKANAATFNALFDIASKARKFVLAEMLQKEMLDRGLELTRFSRFSLINHHGIKGDGEGVRQAYHEFVAAGEFVDSSVISCVVQAFVSCREPAAAEFTFESAKRMHRERKYPIPPPMTWRMRRDVSRYLARRSDKTRQASGVSKPEESTFVEASVAPGLPAYKSLINYYSIVAGDLQRVQGLLGELEASGLPGRGRIFLDLFKGFTIYGGMLYSEWTHEKLEHMWQAFVAAVEADDTTEDPVFFTHSMVSLIIGAFARCADANRMYDVWHDIQTMWTPNEEERLAIEAELQAHASRVEARSQIPRGKRAQDINFYLR